MRVTESLQSGRIKGFYETSLVDWHGKISSVIFLSGCNLRCPYCHNHELVLESDSFQAIPFQWVTGRLQEFIGWIDGVVISGGEPCLYARLPEMIQGFRELSLKVKLDTNGTKPDMLVFLLDSGLVDYVAMDVKAPLDSTRYSRCTGIPVQISDIQKSLSAIVHSTVAYELRMTVCPALIKKRDIQDLARQLEGSKLFVLQSYNPQNPLDSDLRKVSPYKKDQMLEFKEIFERYVDECRVVI
ncbi:MAG: anaerobic ribonucleoside-triphosphate reductase activating protein [bacterium]